MFSGSGSGVQELGPPVFRLGRVTQNRALPCLGLFPALQGWGVRVYVREWESRPHSGVLLSLGGQIILLNDLGGIMAPWLLAI